MLGGSWRSQRTILGQNSNDQFLAPFQESNVQVICCQLNSWNPFSNVRRITCSSSSKSSVIYTNQAPHLSRVSKQKIKGRVGSCLLKRSDAQRDADSMADVITSSLSTIPILEDQSSCRSVCREVGEYRRPEEPSEHA